MRQLPTSLRFAKNIARHFSSQSEIAHEIKRLTLKSRDHLTPELLLHLITPECPLWHSPGHDCPFNDPFWAFYWPGGQALTRFLLDNPSLIRGRSVLDVGSGCAASSIASVMSGAVHVTANDICPVAAIAMEMNSRLNQTPFSISTDNYIGQPCKHYDVILLGDMFYDPEFANVVFKWLQRMHDQGKDIYVGDPGRLSFLNHPMKQRLHRIDSYELLDDCQKENNGLTQGVVWKFTS